MKKCRNELCVDTVGCFRLTLCSFIVKSVEFKDTKTLGNVLVGNALKSFIRKSRTGFKKDIRRDGFYLSRFTTIGLFKSFFRRRTFTGKSRGQTSYFNSDIPTSINIREKKYNMIKY